MMHTIAKLIYVNPLLLKHAYITYYIKVLWKDFGVVMIVEILLRLKIFKL